MAVEEQSSPNLQSIFKPLLSVWALSFFLSFMLTLSFLLWFLFKPQDDGAAVYLVAPDANGISFYSHRDPDCSLSKARLCVLTETSLHIFTYTLFHIVCTCRMISPDTQASESWSVMTVNLPICVVILISYRSMWTSCAEAHLLSWGVCDGTGDAAWWSVVLICSLLLRWVEHKQHDLKCAL